MLCRIIPLKEVSEERPDICVLAEFPSEGRFVFSEIFMVET